MTQYQIIFVLELLTLFACGVLFGAAWRGRAVNLLPICRKCRFDLRGHETMPEKCPECLADLSRSGAVTNRRAPYWRRLTIALLVACLTAMVTLWLNARPRAIEIWWEKNRPFWLIQLRLPSGDKETWALARGRVETGALDADQQIELLEASVDLLTTTRIPRSPAMLRHASPRSGPRESSPRSWCGNTSKRCFRSSSRSPFRRSWSYRHRPYRVDRSQFGS